MSDYCYEINWTLKNVWRMIRHGDWDFEWNGSPENIVSGQSIYYDGWYTVGNVAWVSWFIYWWPHE